MSEESQTRTRLNELLALCIEAERLGVPLNQTALCERFPDEAEALAEFLKDHAAMKALAAAPPAAESPGHAVEFARDDDGVARLGHYRLIEEIGRGGMGAVFKAWQEGVNRFVAVKVISAGPLASQEELRRFQAEAEAAAGLNHPGLVPIYEVDIAGGRPFYSMEYVPGTTLAVAAREKFWSFHKIAAVMAEVVEAIACAHSQGVVHRDLKPANVLIDAAGRPRVTDFGLAKRLAADGFSVGPAGESNSSAGSEATKAWPLMATQTGAVLGTPAYMAPEQAAGSKQIGPRSDIYSAGAILYELLTGEVPFRGSSPLETMSLVLEGRLDRVRSRNPLVPADLATIVEKCLEREPADRYQTASDLAEDLRRFLAGEPICSRGLSMWGRVVRAVGQSRHVSHFRHWGQAVVGFGATVLAAHLVLQLLAWRGLDTWWSVYLTRGGMFAGLWGILRWSRSGSLMPRDAVERLVWVVFTAYLAAYVAASFVEAARGAPASSIYAVAALLGGMAFFTLGCHVWGACYLVGVAFFIAAPILALVPDYSALGFGLLWGATLATLGFRYWWLNRVLPRE